MKKKKEKNLKMKEAMPKGQKAIMYFLSIRETHIF